MSTITVPTADTAPRDLDGLARLGTYRITKLGETLGLCAEGSNAVAFYKMAPDDKIKAVAQALAAYDAAHIGNGAAEPQAAPKKRQPPVQAPVTNGQAAPSVPASAQNDVGTILQMLKEVMANQGVLAERLEDSNNKLSQQLRLSLILNLLMAEQILGVHRTDALQMVQGEEADIGARLQEMIQTMGKGKKGK